MSEKRKRVVLTLEQKLDIVTKVNSGVSVSKVALEYGIGIQTVRDIVKNKPKLEDFIQNSNSSQVMKKRKTMKNSTYEQLDTTMIKWFQQKRAEGAPVSGPMCMAQANFFFKKLGLTGEFNATVGWLRRFKERHGIRELQIQGEQLSGDVVAATEFCGEFEELIKAKKFVKEQIYNADETGLYWRAMPTKTLASEKEKRAPGYKVSKDRITILCCANASGEDKLPLAVVGKSKSPRSLKNIKNLPVTYFSHNSAWITRDIFKEWFSGTFVPHVKKYLQKKELPQEAVLVIDNAPSHPTQLMSEDGKIFVHFLPPNVTALVQPMDQGVIETMKKIYRKTIMLDLILCDSSDPLKFWKSLSIKEAIYTIADSWQKVKATTVTKAFQKIVPDPQETDTGEAVQQSSAADEFSQEEVDNLTTQLQAIDGCQQVTKENILEWLEVDKCEQGYKLLSDEEIVENAIASTSAAAGNNEPETEKDESDDSEDEVSFKTLVSSKEALTAAETLLSYFECHSDIDYSDVLHVRRFISVIKKKNWEKMKQSKITNFFQRRE